MSMNSWQVGHTNGPVASYPRLNGAAPAPPLTAQPGRLAQMLPRWSCWWGHSHRATRQPDPGTDALAYQALGLVEFSPIGWGDHNRQQLNPLQGQTLFAGRALATSGIGGLAQGQFITQPLIVPQQLLSEDLGNDSNWIGLD